MPLMTASSTVVRKRGRPRKKNVKQGKDGITLKQLAANKVIGHYSKTKPEEVTTPMEEIATNNVTNKSTENEQERRKYINHSKCW